MSEPNIQHKPAFTTPAGFGFDDDGRRVPVSMPEQHDDAESKALRDVEASRIENELWKKLLSWTLSKDSQADACAVGRRVLVLAFVAQIPEAPQTLDELADRLRVSKSRACQLATELRNGGWELTRSRPTD